MEQIYVFSKTWKGPRWAQRRHQYSEASQVFYHGGEQANEEGFSLALYSHPAMKPASKIPKKSATTGSETQKDASRTSNFKGKS